jgi:MscS family membrane protein
MIDRIKICIIGIILLLTVICFGQEAAEDSSEQNSYSAIDSAYTAVMRQQPQVDIGLLVIKLFWISISIILSILFWRYLLQPFVKMVFNKSTYQEELVTALKFLVIIATAYLIISEIINPSQNLYLILIGTACLGFALAARDFLRDIVSGLGLLFSHRLKKGDLISINEISGELINLGLKTSVIKTQTGAVYIIPNNTLTQNVIARRTPDDLIESVDVLFYLPNNVNLIKVKEIAHRTASLSRFIYLNKPIYLKLTNEYNEGQSIIKLKLSAFVLNSDYAEQFISDTTESVLKELMEHGLMEPVVSRQ